MYCAANHGKLSQIPEIANAYSLSEVFLFKILKPLTKNGLVESVRGRNGGIRLAKDADMIRLSEVVRITEDNFEMAECFKDDGTDCPLVNSCELNSALREALNAFFTVLDKYTIEDLAITASGSIFCSAFLLKNQLSRLRLAQLLIFDFREC